MTDLALPTGTVTVTFLFTEELGEQRYVEVLAEHRHCVRATFATQGGLEVDTEGDAFPLCLC